MFDSNNVNYSSFAKQKGLSPIFIILTVIILALLGYFVYKGIKPTQNSPTTTNISNLPNALIGIPIYPNVTYDPKFGQTQSYIINGVCGEGQLCKSTKYEFATADPTDAVFNWYKTQNLNGFKFVPTTDVVDQGRYGKEYYGSMLSGTNKTFQIDILAAYQGSYGSGKNSVVYISGSAPFDWPKANSAEISGWPIFTSKDGLLTFKYPTGIKVNQNCSVCQDLSVNITDNPQNLTSQAFGLNAEKDDVPKATIVKNKPTYLGSLDFTIFYGMGGAGSPGPNVYIARNGKIISFTTDLVGVESLNNILSTLQFLK